MLKLYYAPDNASLAVRLALDEAQIPHETVLVDRATGAQKTAKYLAVNPTGLIPALETPHGILAETAACLLWLAEQYPDARLAPPVEHAQRGAFLRWLFYLSNTVHADLRRVFYADRYVTQARLPDHYSITTGHMLGHFAILEKAISDTPDLFAPPSALSLYICPMLRWAVLYPQSLDRWMDLKTYPALHSIAVTLEQRSSVQNAIVKEGLGPKPFSSPIYPSPPEGAAL